MVEHAQHSAASLLECYSFFKDTLKQSRLAGIFGMNFHEYWYHALRATPGRA
jgi:hypothetical protein